MSLHLLCTFGTVQRIICDLKSETSEIICLKCL